MVQGQGSAPQMARNNYFTGKLLVERDFTDEQRYMVEKQLRHNATLHGSGCVTGLRVKQHPEPARRDRYVVIEPGVALDSHGQEILVRQEEFFDVQQRLAETVASTTANDGKEHTLQILLRYSEYFTEQVPAFFDDCGDGATAQPNRIMESYDFDVRLDPIARPGPLDNVSLTWQDTLSIDHISSMLVDETNHRFYILTTVEHSSTLYVYRHEARTPHLLASQALQIEATDLALSRDGSRLYVAVRQNGLVLVLDTARIGNTHSLVNELPGSGNPESVVYLAVSPWTGYLYVLDAARRSVTPWRTGINHCCSDVTDYQLHSIRVGKDPCAIVASPDGKWLFVANEGDKTISAIDTTRHEHSPIVLHIASLSPSALAVADTTDGLKLYVADRTNRTIAILALELRSNPAFVQLGSSHATGPEIPIAIAVDPNGRWLYLLLADRGGKGHVQVIDAYRIEQGRASVVGASVPVGSKPCSLILVHSRHHLYIANRGTKDEQGIGGVTTFQIYEESCEDLFSHTLDGDSRSQYDEDGVILATIEKYKFGSSILDAQIDNLSDRHILPNTDLMADMLRCILANGGGKGRRGEEGPAGRDGAGIEAVQALIVDCDNPGSASLCEINEKRTLILEIPRGCDAPASPPVEYTRICGINWTHKGTVRRDELEEHGLLIAFSRKVRAGDINRHTFQALVSVEEDGLISWYGLTTRNGRNSEQVRGVELVLEEGPNGTCKIRAVENFHPHANKFVNGAWFRPTRLPSGTLTLRVILKGDFIQDERHLGVDVDHLPPWLPLRPTGNGVEGGTFESWFTVEEPR